MGEGTRSAASENTREDPPTFGRAIANVAATGHGTFGSRAATACRHTNMAQALREDEELLLGLWD